MPPDASMPKKSRQRPAKSAAPPSASTEDYLERIDGLFEQKGYARVVDIAAALQVSQPSVTAMVKRLAGAGYLKYERYRGLVMTEEGRAVARRIKDRHSILQRFLSLLGVDEDTQEADSEGMEHSLSAPTLAMLTDLTDFLENTPAVLKAFAQHRAATAKAAAQR
jgi:Mn-dependent DtxR family transcriptional regulator